MRRVLIGSLVALSLLIAGGFFYLHGKRTEIRLTEVQLQEQMASRFPVERTVLFLIQWRLLNPSLEFLPERQRIATGLEVQVNLRIDGQRDPLGGRIELESALRYDDSQGAFYLVDPTITRFNISGIPEEHVMRVQDSMRSALAEIFQKKPVYTLRATDMKQGAARLILRNVRIENTEIVVVLGV